MPLRANMPGTENGPHRCKVTEGSQSASIIRQCGGAHRAASARTEAGVWECNRAYSTTNAQHSNDGRLKKHFHEEAWHTARGSSGQGRPARSGASPTSKRG